MYACARELIESDIIKLYCFRQTYVNNKNNNYFKLKNEET